MARRNSNRNTAAAATPKSKFTARTPGLEDVHFTRQDSKAAAEFGIFRSKLSRHIGSKYKSAMGSKAMEEMAYPTIVKPVEPIQEYRMDKSTPPNEADVPVLDDKVYRMKVDKYMVNYKEVRANKIAWVEINARIIFLSATQLPRSGVGVESEQYMG